ncbi:MAG: glycosyltransferase family 4 protein [Ilumatobacteraceae bacterium]
MAAPSVAFDVGPLVGARTGVGAAVAALRDALTERDDVVLLPYVTSFRARPQAGVRRLPIPAAVAHRMWGRSDHPRADRWLHPAAVVHGTNYVVPPSRAPRIVSVYDCWFLRHPDLAHPDVVRAGRVLVRALRSGAVAHASSRATADAITELVPAAEVRTIPLAALPLPPPAPACPVAELSDRDFVLALSTVERRKNLPRLVEAFGMMAGDHPDLRLVIAGGDGDDRPAVDAAIDRLTPAAADRVMLTGWVDDPARSWLLHHARVLAYPSLDEGFGFPLLDAMQAGTPVVASTAGSIPEVAGDAALLVDPLDVPALAGALSRTIDHDDVRQALVGAGAARLASYSWSRTAADITALYREMAGAR